MGTLVRGMARRPREEVTLRKVRRKRYRHPRREDRGVAQEGWGVGELRQSTLRDNARFQVPSLGDRQDSTHAGFRKRTETQTSTASLLQQPGKGRSSLEDFF